jgi:hypothetical protein
VTSKTIPTPGLTKPQLTLLNTILTIYINSGRPDLVARDCGKLCAVRAKTLARHLARLKAWRLCWYLS